MTSVSRIIRPRIGTPSPPLSTQRLTPIPQQEKRCLLPADLRIIGFAPDQISASELTDLIKSPIDLQSPRHAEQLNEFCDKCSYVSGHEGGDAAFQMLRAKLEELGQGKKEQNRLFYMALPPSVFVPMAEGLKRFCYSERGVSKIIVSLFTFFHLPHTLFASCCLSLC